MGILNDKGQLFGRFNIIDTVVGGALVLAALGVILVQTGWHETSGQVVQGESDIAITVQIPNLKTLDRQLFEPGKKTAITIRNQPRGEVAITDVKSQPVQIMLPGAGGQPMLAQDLSQRNGYDYLITLKDHAKVTADGYVTEGVKVKVGLPIELEGFKYRVYGKIVDVQPQP